MKNRLKKHFRQFLLFWFPKSYKSSNRNHIHENCCEQISNIEMAMEMSETFDVRNMTMASIDMDKWLPDTDIQSEVSSEDQRKLLHQHIPPRTISKIFHGTGESWLLSFFPDIKVYKWTGENNHLIQGSSSNLMIGSSESQFGLWRDENFNMEGLKAVSTFENKPLLRKEDLDQARQVYQFWPPPGLLDLWALNTQRNPTPRKVSFMYTMLASQPWFTCVYYNFCF